MTCHTTARAHATLDVSEETDIAAADYPWESLMIDSADDDGDPLTSTEPFLSGDWDFSVRIGSGTSRARHSPCGELDLLIAIGDVRQDRDTAPPYPGVAKAIEAAVRARSDDPLDGTLRLRFACHPSQISAIEHHLDPNVATTFQDNLVDLDSGQRLAELVASSHVFVFVGHSVLKPGEPEARDLDFGAFHVDTSDLARSLKKLAKRPETARTRLIVLGACRSRSATARRCDRNVRRSFTAGRRHDAPTASDSPLSRSDHPSSPLRYEI